MSGECRTRFRLACRPAYRNSATGAFIDRPHTVRNESLGMHDSDLTAVLS
jgi:hypothetical protein